MSAEQFLYVLAPCCRAGSLLTIQTPSHNFRESMANSFRMAAGKYLHLGNQVSATVPTWVKLSDYSSMVGYQNASVIATQS